MHMEKQTSEKLKDFFSGFKEMSFKKGETILKPYDKPYGVFYLTEGYARLYSISKNAQELTLIIFKTEDIFPLRWTITKIPNFYYLETITPVKLYRAPRKDFLKFIKNNNDILFEISSRILLRLDGLLKRMEYAMFGNARSKVASILLICAERFGKRDKAGNIVIQVPLTHHDIARLIGMARETVSIEMKKLQEMSLIKYRGKYLAVKDIQGLVKESVTEPVD